MMILRCKKTYAVIRSTTPLAVTAPRQSWWGRSRNHGSRGRFGRYPGRSAWGRRPSRSPLARLGVGRNSARRQTAVVERGSTDPTEDEFVLPGLTAPGDQTELPGHAVPVVAGYTEVLGRRVHRLDTERDSISDTQISLFRIVANNRVNGAKARVWSVTRDRHDGRQRTPPNVFLADDFEQWVCSGKPLKNGRSWTETTPTASVGPARTRSTRTTSTVPTVARTGSPPPSDRRHGISPQSGRHLRPKRLDDPPRTGRVWIRPN